ncbi:MAG: FG-GAP repeat domain-containing protein, partial [Saprospiraceae bacterium]
MKVFLPAIFCKILLITQATAQLYTNTSANLPDNGAKGASMDVRAADLDSDGDLDIVLANEFQPNTILLNNGTGIFTNTSAGNLPQKVHDSEDVAIADFNGDGKLDLVFCSEDDVTLGLTKVHEFYLGNGQDAFTETSFQLPDSESNAVVSVDISGDNLPDLLFGNKGSNGVLVNNGDGTFTAENNRIPQVNRTTQDLALADVDADGDLDLFEGNENGNLLHLNDGTGHFIDMTTELLPQNLNIETRKVTFGDVDSDNDLDVFLSNVAFIQGKDRQNRLFLNDGTGHFSDATATRLPIDNDHTIDAIFEDV